ncbi:unnamed protein product [Mucor hiemalis]
MGLLPPTSNSPVANSGYDELMKEAKELIERKDKIEEELRELEDRLIEAGVGMSESLVDRSGFPRFEIDVHSVRISRNLVIRLRNDHKAVMKDIESVLHRIHEEKRKQIDTQDEEPAPTNTEVPDLIMTEAPVAFAIVNAVAPDSPAYSAGLRRNDSIFKFGDIDASNHQRLQAVNLLISQSENLSVNISVLRDGHTIQMTVVPRTGWGGRGTLGCHLLPL